MRRSNYQCVNLSKLFFHSFAFCQLITISFLFLACGGKSSEPKMEKESLTPMKDGKAPQTFEELWAGYDPRVEPLDVEVVKEWEEDGVILRVVRYNIGFFKGKKSIMAGVYGFPKGGAHLPGLVQIHGGGQFADYRAPLTNAKRGYATISLAWAGRIAVPDYKGKTTEWGALDAYHAAPYGNKNNHNWTDIFPAAWTLDTVESPRNSNWFLCALAARRALTFLAQQPEVDSSKLGVYGHSMGGQLTIFTAAADRRVKAAAPSCGGISFRYSDSTLIGKTISDNANLSHITCPIIFLIPSNDFNGQINDLEKALDEIKSKDWRVTCSPHHNHQDTPEYFVCGLLWFDQYLKGIFSFPQTPTSEIVLNRSSKVPTFITKIDTSKPMLYVDIYYTQQGKAEGEPYNYWNAINRFWHHVKPTQSGDNWIAELPLLTTDKPLWAYANVVYSLNEPVVGAEYYYSIYTANKFNLSSKLCVVTPEQLKAAKIKATDIPSFIIETFTGDWQKEWFTYDLGNSWARRTHKLYDDKWKAPLSAKLAIDIRSNLPNRFVVGIDTFDADIELKGGDQWQTIKLSPSDFQSVHGNVLSGWNNIKELRITDKENLSVGEGDKQKIRSFGAPWKGSIPEFSNMRWISTITKKGK